MKTNKILLAERKVDRTASLGLYLQGIGLTGLLLLVIWQPDFYRQAVFALVSVALVASFLASRFYIATGKRLERHKTFSEVEGKRRKWEWFVRFFAPYPFWIYVIVMFSS